MQTAERQVWPVSDQLSTEEQRKSTCAVTELRRSCSFGAREALRPGDWALPDYGRKFLGFLGVSCTLITLMPIGTHAQIGFAPCLFASSIYDRATHEYSLSYLAKLFGYVSGIWVASLTILCPKSRKLNDYFDITRL